MDNTINRVLSDLRINKKNLKYYMTKYANSLDFSSTDLDDVARIVLFRKIGLSTDYINKLRKKKVTLGELLGNNMLQYPDNLRNVQYEELTYRICKEMMGDIPRDVPIWDTPLLGILTGRLFIAAIIGIALGVLSLALQSQWDSCLDRIYRYSILLLWYVIFSTFIDDYIWRKRLSRIREQISD